MTRSQNEKMKISETSINRVVSISVIFHFLRYLKIWDIWNFGKARMLFYAWNAPYDIKSHCIGYNTQFLEEWKYEKFFYGQFKSYWMRFLWHTYAFYVIYLSTFLNLGIRNQILLLFYIEQFSSQYFQFKSDIICSKLWQQILYNTFYSK